MSDSEIEVLPVVCCDICEDVLEDGWSENVRTETYSVVEACEACTRSLDWCSECDMHAQSVATLSESDWDGDGRHVCYYCLGRFYTRCGSCHNHYRFNDSHNCDPSIHDYTYKPYPVFRWASGEREVVPGTAFFGVEIESENRTSYGRSSVLALLRSGDVDEERHYFKYDGSLDSDVGVELVSHPSTLAAWREDSSYWQGVLEAMVAGGQRAWLLDNAGIHVHVSRGSFSGDSHLARFLLFFARNQRMVEGVACRVSSYARFDGLGDKVALKVKAGYNASHFDAVNVSGRDTVEVRVFRSSLKWERLLADIEFVSAVQEFTRSAGVSGFARGRFSWLDFVEFVEAGNFPQLAVVISGGSF